MIIEPNEFQGAVKPRAAQARPAASEQSNRQPKRPACTARPSIRSAIIWSEIIAPPLAKRPRTK